MNKIIVILGQTSTGKSDFAVEIAKKIDGEIISSDSRQVYKGMDLGTGKITKKEMQGVVHYLLDVASPFKVFSVSDFQKLANKKIEEIMEKNKVPIICGGTGFYIDAIVDGTVLPRVPPNKKLRGELEKKSTEQLLDILIKLDFVRAQNIDVKNRVRLIRAIEICKTLGKVPPRQGLGGRSFDFLKIGLTLPPEILKERINTRLLKRIKKGMIKEVDNLHKEGVSWKRMEALGLEYRYTSLHLQGKLSKEEMIEKINTETWHYAKRQKTWFKRDQSIIWIDPTKNKDKNIVFKEVKKFLK
jgi:tRNA dimethylallyltransferase